MSATIQKGTQAYHGAKPGRTYASGRTCAAPGCITKLSSYNPKDRCFVHRVYTVPRLRGRTTNS